MELQIPAVLSSLIIISLFVKGTDAIKCYSGSETWNADGAKTADTKVNANCPTAMSCNRYPTSGFVAKKVAHTIAFDCGPCDSGRTGCHNCDDDFCNSMRDPNSGHVSRVSLSALFVTLGSGLLMRIYV